MAKHPETLAMELAVEQMAASRRRQFWTKKELVGVFLKRHAPKRQELQSLSELDKRAQEDTSGRDAFAHTHRDRELKRLEQMAARVLKSQKEEEFGLHRRFGSFKAIRSDGVTEWRWFEVRYCEVRFLQFWQDLKNELKTSLGITTEETQILIDTARERHATTMAKVYGEAMAKIHDLREGRAA